MAHYAELDNQNKVIRVIVVANNAITDGSGVEQEQLGVDLLTTLYGSGEYKQASFNGNFRKNFPTREYVYDSTRDAFISLQPYPSWTLNEATCRYESPVAHPNDDKIYIWNELITNWMEIA
tara:strand:+ start:1720 stop:2082 length:363 start_codon:yes stop_codon:yes gene_type:complete